MREIFILVAHLLVTLAKVGAWGGLGAVAAEYYRSNHQLLITKRAQPQCKIRYLSQSLRK
jgi:hypothetical protein